jgi:hypothetical protein
MVILTHVLIALASLALSAYSYFNPSQTMLRVSYGLIALTLASGTYLLLSKPSHMIEACMMGLAYLAIISIATVAARYKLTQMSRV